MNANQPQISSNIALYFFLKKKVKVPSYVNDSIGEGQGGLDKNDLEDRFKGAMSKDL